MNNLAMIGMDAVLSDFKNLDSENVKLSGNGWGCWQHVIVGVLTLAQHWTNTKVSTVEVLLLAQR